MAAWLAGQFTPVPSPQIGRAYGSRSQPSSPYDALASRSSDASSSSTAALLPHRDAGNPIEMRATSGGDTAPRPSNAASTLGRAGSPAAPTLGRSAAAAATAGGSYHPKAEPPAYGDAYAMDTLQAYPGGEREAHGAGNERHGSDAIDQELAIALQNEELAIAAEIENVRPARLSARAHASTGI